ncbi:hypothetical protein Pth03_26930 [Planotetraspora thailandica]|uniref:alpha-L-fucosidase n=1 Tax=Planotetraspora thailandica TaxID=487172 RepID=A0A8J3XVH2_9ACTN|nr:alpha-L-fucosidase [Planotetraspora thailandica]GII54304.1 hypothetical protein Pth03_26930 [Planotetraspora thailandica]
MARPNEIADDPIACGVRRQEWLRDSALGLFLHWGMRTSPAYADVQAWEDRVTADGWTAERWLDKAGALHAGYIVLASFHSRLGYVRVWPSEVPGSPATRRDFLGELVSAATRAGVKVLLYMTDDPQWHDETGTESLDSAAYSAYKGSPVDLTTRDGFGEFAYDNFTEVMRRYPGLAGFWIDRENAYWRRSGLYDRIRTERPGWILACNDKDTPPADTVMDVVAPGMSVSALVPRLTEDRFTVADTWWFDGDDPAVNHGRVIGRIVANAASSVKSLLAFGPQHGGLFPPNQEAFGDFAARYLDAIWESVGGTEGGGQSGPSGTARPGPRGDGVTTLTTVRRDDPDRHYLHVVARPPDGTVRVADGGLPVVEARDVRTGDAVAFAQSGGHLTISGITSWDPYDTVFALRTARASSGTASPHPAASENTPHPISEGTSS